MGNTYRHLDQTMRDRIKALRDDGYGVRKIGRTIGLSHSTVSRELKRNSCGNDSRTTPAKQQTYDPATAQHKAYVRRKYARYQGKKIQEDAELRSFIISKLQEHWNPDEIAGYLKRNPAYGFYASKTAIYEWLQSAWGQPYCAYLYTKRYHRKSRRPAPAKQPLIPERVSITQRPRGAANRSRYGHWEKDAVLSSKRSGGTAGLSVSQERKSRLVVADLVASMRPDEHADSAQRLAARAKVLSITYDNGIENRSHAQLRALGIATFFTDPYSSWQKGSVEHANKMLRRYFPKGTDFSTITQTEVDEAVRLINNKPRKILGYRSSLEVALEKGVIGGGGAVRG